MVLQLAVGRQFVLATERSSFLLSVGPMRVPTVGLSSNVTALVLSIRLPVGLPVEQLERLA